MVWPPRLSRQNRIWRSYRVAQLLFTTLWVITRERNRVLHAHARGQYGIRPDVNALRRVMVEFREAAVALGGLMIKLGQFLSARADLLPQEALAELALLQDEVSPESFSDIARTIEHELRAPLTSIFASIDSCPAGSASLGQVHRARLLSGETVAVKVQRPGVDRLVRIDLSTLRVVLRVVRTLFPATDTMVDTHRLYLEFSRTIYEELDYRREGHYAERFARLFAERDDVVVPEVVWAHTTDRVLTLTWIHGIKVSDTKALKAAGVNPRAVAERLTALYLEQMLVWGFFHADPHPGNIFVRPKPDGFQVAFIDFGMMGTITLPHKRALSTVFAAVIQQNAPLLVDGLETLGFIGTGAHRETLEQALAQLLSRYIGLTMGELRDLDPIEVMGDVEALLYGQPFRLPYQFAFLGRAAGTLSGLVTMLDPTFNFVEVALPYAREYLKQDGFSTVLQMLGVESLGQLGRILTREGLAITRSLVTLPRLAERVLGHLEHGDLRVIIESPELDPRLRARIGGRIAARALRRPVPAWLPLSLAGVAAILLALWRRAANAR